MTRRFRFFFRATLFQRVMRVKGNIHDDDFFFDGHYGPGIMRRHAIRA